MSIKSTVLCKLWRARFSAQNYVSSDSDQCEFLGLQTAVRETAWTYERTIACSEETH